ncbi:MAG: Arc family DNA-binding protein [Ktedonobacteraceae bacterium]
MEDKEKRFSVRFPLDVLEAVKQAAKEDERSINSEVIWLLRKALGLRKGKHEKGI